MLANGRVFKLPAMLIAPYLSNSCPPGGRGCENTTHNSTPEFTPPKLWRDIALSTGYPSLMGLWQ